MKKPTYSEKQLKIISGEIPLSSVDGRAARALYKKAIVLGDTDLAEKAKKRLNQCKAITLQKNLDRVNMMCRLKRDKKFQWKQPKEKEYTEHQKQVVRGDIPLSKVHTNELVHIYMKAKSVGDFELSERIYDLIMSRREEAEEKRNAHLETFHKKRKCPEYEENHNIGYARRKTLSPWEKQIVNVEIGLEEITADHLKHILKLVKETGDETTIKRVEKMIEYKEHPEVVYITQDHNEAMDILERLMGHPIRRPNTWFT